MSERQAQQMDTPSGRQPFVPCDQFIETPFALRFQEILQDAQRDQSSHVISAPPGSGKTWSIIDFVTSQGAEKRHNEPVRLHAITTCSPVNNNGEQALGIALAECLGVVPIAPWSRLRVWLVGQLVREHVQIIVMDDAHDLSIPHLKFLKELKDRLALPPYNHRLAICLVAASFGSENPLVTNLSRPEMLWEQFRQRLDDDRPFCRIPGHTQAEVHDILSMFESYYRLHHLLRLHLVRWTEPIYDCLVHPTLDLAGSKRATMGNLTKLVNLTVKAAYLEGLDDITPDLLDKTIHRLTLGSRQDTIIDSDTSEGASGLTVALVKPDNSPNKGVPVD